MMGYRACQASVREGIHTWRVFPPPTRFDTSNTAAASATDPWTLTGKRSLVWALLLLVLLASTTTPVDAKRHHHRTSHRPAHHQVARSHPASPPTPAPVTASALTSTSKWASPTFLKGGFAVAFLAFIGAGAGWFHSHRDRRRLQTADRQWRQRVNQIQSELAAEHGEKAQLRAQLVAARNVLATSKADADRKREWAQANSLKDTDNQFRFIEAASLRRKRLLNRPEERTFNACLTFVKGRRLKACPQVSMGEIIRSIGEHRDATNAFSSFNSKRVDMLICDGDWYPLIAVEHQGAGHNQGNAEERDRIKRLALERAGIGLVETYDDDDRAAILTALEEELVRIRGG